MLESVSLETSVSLSPYQRQGSTGHLDLVADGFAQGWALDHSSMDKSSTLTLQIDGRAVGSFDADVFRDDLIQLGYDGKHAFIYSIPKKHWDGEQHQVAVVFSTTGENLPGSPVLARMPLYKIEEIRGFIDNINEREITGWVFDIRNPSEAVLVELVIDEVPVRRYLANDKRDDLKLAQIGNGRCAFRFSTPLHILDDQEHTLAVRVAETALELPGARLFRAKHSRPYRNFSEYLRWALFYHEIHPPFTEFDKVVIADMLQLGNHYAEKYKANLNTPLVSIIMPTFNRAGLIREAINSVFKQDYTNWELIVVDDNSSDHTESVIKGYQDSRVKYIRCVENGGPSAARAVGMRSASGALFAYLDSDNTWDKKYLYIMVNHLLEHENAESIYCAQIVHYVGDGADNKKVIRYTPFNRSLIENNNFIDLNCYMHSAKIFRELGGFRSDIRMLEDWDLIVRYTAVSTPVALPCLLSHYYFGKSSDQVTFSEDYTVTLEKIQSTLASRAFTIDCLSTSAHNSDVPGEYLLYHLSSELRSYNSQKFVSIIIPNYEAGRYLEACISAIFKFTPKGSFEVIIVDNASIDISLKVLDRYEYYDNVKIIRNSTNYGYTYAINQGINVARSGSDVILMNNDALVTQGWLEAFWEVAETVEDVGLIIPRQTLPAKTETSGIHVPRSNPLLEIDVNLSAHHSNVVDPLFDRERGLMELSFAAFFCVYITRDCLESTGLLDDKNGRHYRSDAIYTDLARYITKKKIVYTPHSKVYHFLQKSTSQLREQDKAMYDVMFVQNRWKSEDVFDGILS